MLSGSSPYPPACGPLHMTPKVHGPCTPSQERCPAPCRVCVERRASCVCASAPRAPPHVWHQAEGRKSPSVCMSSQGKIQRKPVATEAGVARFSCSVYSRKSTKPSRSLHKAVDTYAPPSAVARRRRPLARRSRYCGGSLCEYMVHDCLKQTPRCLHMPWQPSRGSAESGLPPGQGRGGPAQVQLQGQCGAVAKNG